MYPAAIIQSAVSVLGNEIIADGIIGPQTIEAIERLTSADRRLVLDFALRLGVILPKSYTWDKLSKWISEAANFAGVPAAYIEFIVRMENQMIGSSFVSVEFEGTFKGLGQFDKNTWDSVMDLPYSYVSNPLNSLVAIGELYKANKQTYMGQTSKNEWTHDIAYLYHNQGAGAAHKFLQTKVLQYPGQSHRALTVFERAWEDYHGKISDRSI